jgi:hypothetical protein
MRRGAKTTTAIPMGTLMNSTHRHGTADTTTAPRMKPNDPASAGTPREDGQGLVADLTFLEVGGDQSQSAGAAIAAPTPWTARAITSMVAGVASPPTSEEALNTTSPGYQLAAPTEDIAGSARSGERCEPELWQCQP